MLMCVFLAGYDDYQIYLLLSCAPIQGHIAGIVDIPNVCTTIVRPSIRLFIGRKMKQQFFHNADTSQPQGLPIDIFNFDISVEKPAEKRDLGSCAFASS
jgi:formamidase